MKNILYAALLFALHIRLLAQPYDCVPGKTYNHYGFYEVPKSIVLLENGDYIISGSAGHLNLPYYNHAVIYALRVDACGDSIWTIVSGQPYESFNDGALYYKLGDNFVIFASSHYAHDSGIYSASLVKISLSGEIIWLRNYENSLKTSGIKDVTQTADGGFAMVGFSQNFPNDYARIWFIKTDSEGNITWQKYYGSNNYSESAEHILQLPDGGYLILGRKNYIPTQFARVWLLRTDEQGNVLWEKLYGNNFYTSGAHIIPINSGYAIVGTQHPGNIWDTSGDAYILKIDTAGIEQWSHAYGGYFYEQLDKVIQLSDGSFMCMGSNSTMGGGGGSADGWLFKVSAAGDSLWSKTYRYETTYNLPEYFWDFQPAPEGGFMICGSALRPAPTNQDAWIIRTDSLGNPCPPYNGCDWAVGVSPPPPYPIKEENAVYVYPNPAQNTLHFTLQNTATPPMSGWQIALYNPTGHRVLHNTLSPASATASVEIGHLPVGIYFYTIEWGGVALARGKIVKSGK